MPVVPLVHQALYELLRIAVHDHVRERLDGVLLESLDPFGEQDGVVVGEHLGDPRDPLVGLVHVVLEVLDRPVERPGELERLGDGRRSVRFVALVDDDAVSVDPVPLRDGLPQVPRPGDGLETVLGPEQLRLPGVLGRGSGDAPDNLEVGAEYVVVCGDVLLLSLTEVVQHVVLHLRGELEHGLVPVPLADGVDDGASHPGRPSDADPSLPCNVVVFRQYMGHIAHGVSGVGADVHLDEPVLLSVNRHLLPEGSHGTGRGRSSVCFPCSHLSMPLLKTGVPCAGAPRRMTGSLGIPVFRYAGCRDGPGCEPAGCGLRCRFLILVSG